MKIKYNINKFYSKKSKMKNYLNLEWRSMRKK